MNEARPAPAEDSRRVRWSGMYSRAQFLVLRVRSTVRPDC